MRLAADALAAIVARIGPFEFIELPICFLLLTVAWLRPRLAEGPLAALEARLGAIGERPGLAMSLVVVVAVLCRGVLLPVMGPPSPMIADETSLVLQAQTLLAGHLAMNERPTADFESVFVTLSPTYASIYPALRSAPMVLGALTGLGFWVGVWISMIALCVASYWMLRAWVGPRYALVGALIVLARYGVFSFWVNSYWGGAFTALGGVLLLGGYRRLVEAPTRLAGALTGLGVLILMTTRPFEGLLFAFPFGVGLLVRFARAAPAARGRLLGAGILACLFVACGGALTAAHDASVTGDWRMAPYSLYRQTTAETPAFLFQAAVPHPPPRYALTGAALDQERAAHERRQTALGWAGAELSRLFNIWTFYIGVALTAPFIAGLAAVRREPVVMSAAALLATGLALETWDFAHYASPAFGVFLLAIVLGLRRLRRWRPLDRPTGLAVSRLAPAALAAGLILPVAVAIAGGPSFGNQGYSAACCAIRALSIHDSIETLLDRVADRNMVEVDTGVASPKTQMIVYNDADIDDARTVWINRDAALNPTTERRYPGRRIWRLGWISGGGACLRPATAGPVRLARTTGWSLGAADTCPGGVQHGPWR